MTSFSSCISKSSPITSYDRQSSDPQQREKMEGAHLPLLPPFLADGRLWSVTRSSKSIVDTCYPFLARSCVLSKGRDERCLQLQQLSSPLVLIRRPASTSLYLIQ